MSTKTITTWGKILNYVEIFITFAMFVVFRVMNMMASGAKRAQVYELIDTQQGFLYFTAGVSVLVIIMSIVLMINNKTKVKGLVLLLLSGVVTLVFSLLGVVLGIITWILCAASIKQLSQKQEEDSFAAQLQNENMQAQNNMYNPAYDNTQNYYNNQNGQYGQNNQYAPNGQYGQNNQYAPNGQYGQNNQYAPNGQYGQNNQYAPNGQYGQNNQYAPNGQYGQNNQYAPNGQYEQPNYNQMNNGQ